MSLVSGSAWSRFLWKGESSKTFSLILPYPGDGDVDRFKRRGDSPGRPGLFSGMCAHFRTDVQQCIVVVMMGILVGVLVGLTHQDLLELHCEQERKSPRTPPALPWWAQR